MVVLSTFPREKDAERIAERLIAKRLAACCNVVPGLVSFFRWEGKQERASECLLLIKTELRRFEELKSFLRAHHPYTLPEVIGLPVQVGDRAYLTWIGKECRP